MQALIAIPKQTFHQCFDLKDFSRLAEKVTVVPESPFDTLPDQIAPEWISGRIDRAELLITGWGTPALTDQIIGRAKRLRAIVHSAGSVKALVPAIAYQKGIAVANVRHALARGVAETALGMVIASAKMFFPLTQETQKGLWRDTPWVDWVMELYQIKIGIIGASEVGKHLLTLLQPFEVDRLVYDPYAAQEVLKNAFGARKVELNELCSTCDIIVVCAPSTPETFHLLGKPQFQLMKNRARLINPARGSLIDEQALAEELGKGRLFAILDVTDPEPPAVNSPLRNSPYCVLTPHIAGHVNNGCLRQGKLLVDEVLHFLSEGKFNWQVNPEALARMG
jgi:phosphoglycerate dehydrogenase-like enzyme